MLPLGPGLSPNDVLQPAFDDETQLRQLFATKTQYDRLADPHVALVEVFDASGYNKDDSCRNRSIFRRLLSAVCHALG